MKPTHSLRRTLNLTCMSLQLIASKYLYKLCSYAFGLWCDFNDHSTAKLLQSISIKNFKNRSIFDAVMRKNKDNFYWVTLYKLSMTSHFCFTLSHFRLFDICFLLILKDSHRRYTQKSMIPTSQFSRFNQARHGHILLTTKIH